MRELLAPYGIEAISAGELGLPEPEETGTTFRANARIKAEAARQGRRACRRSPTIPGLWSMRSAARPASIRRAGPGPTRTSAAPWRQVEEKLRERGATTPEQRKAHFVSALCVAWPDGHVEEFEGRVDGTLVWPPRGDKGFGYDPMFLPDGHARTFGEMTSEEKHGLPPRGRACRTAPAPSSSWRRPAFVSPRRRGSRSRRDPEQADRERRANRDCRGGERTAFGVYVHWPFCLSKCPYCDFNSHVRHAGIDEARYVRAFAAEIAATAARVPGRTVSTIFFGGGTPSLMQPATVGAILDAIAQHWAIAPDVEVTLEANPTSVEATRFRGYRAAGVNRVSLGVQALDDARAEGARPAAYGARSARRGRDRARRVRALFVRSDLRAAAADAAAIGRASSSARSPKPPSICRSISSPSSRTRRSRRCMRPASSSCPTRTPRARSTT